MISHKRHTTKLNGKLWHISRQFKCPHKELMESGSVEFLGKKSIKPSQTECSTDLDITATTIPQHINMNVNIS
jgi:hypothetical protein